MVNKNKISEIEKVLKNDNIKKVALVAPSFVTDFSYPSIIYQLKKLGFDKTVELTFGAKMINRDYHEILKKNKDKMMIASPCPGIVNTIKNNFPKLKNSLIQVDSPMTAMGKVCRKHFKSYKLIFISPCDFKKTEANESKYIDYVIDYTQLKELFTKNKIKKPFFKKKKLMFDKFYNDYTKIYPLSGGLAQTAHLKGILKKDQIKILDGISDVVTFLKNPDPKVKFLDCLFCKGGCVGGPHTNQKISVKKKAKKVIKYLIKSNKECIPEDRKGLIKKASGITFKRKL